MKKENGMLKMLKTYDWQLLLVFDFYQNKKTMEKYPLEIIQKGRLSVLVISVNIPLLLLKMCVWKTTCLVLANCLIKAINLFLIK